MTEYERKNKNTNYTDNDNEYDYYIPVSEKPKNEKTTHLSVGCLISVITITYRKVQPIFQDEHDGPLQFQLPYQTTLLHALGTNG